MLNPIEHYSMENLPSVYDEEALTALELAARTAAKVNEAVRAVNKLHTRVEEIFSAELASHVDKWLTEHPEVTTSLQDGEITADKLHDSLKMATINDFVIPQMFGAVGDGVHDDTAAFQQLNGKRAYIPKGTYRISSVEYGPNTIILGAGMGNTIIQQIGDNTDMMVFKNATCAGLSNITLMGDGWNAAIKSRTPYTGLLKIYTTSEHNNYSHYCVYEHIHIYKSNNSGLVLLSKDTGSGVEDTTWNWVHHFNDFRIEYCNAWCMIDETTDNRFDNFYLNEGGLGNLLMQYVGNNMYDNFKVDQPYGAGYHGEPDGWDSGALIVCKNSGGFRMTNFDIQSSYYDGMKIESSSIFHFEGMFHNIGYQAPEIDPVCVRMYNVHNSTLTIHHSVGGDFTAYTAYINSNCSNVQVQVQENLPLPYVNNGTKCSVIKVADLPQLFNKVITETNTVSNLLNNPVPANADDWSLTNATIDSNAQVSGTYSFKINSGSSATGEVAQWIPNIVAGHKYLFVATVKTENPSTEYIPGVATPYLHMSQGGEHLPNVDGLKANASNARGYSVLAYSCVAKSNESIKFMVLNYQNNGTFYVGNMYAIDLTENKLFMDTQGYTNAIVEQFKVSPLEVKTAVNESLSYTEIMEALRYLLMNKEG